MSKVKEAVGQLGNLVGAGKKGQPQNGVPAEDRKAEIEAQMRKLQEEKDAIDKAEADIKAAEDQAKKEAEAKARKEAEEKLKAEAAAKEAEEKAKKEAEEKAKKEAEEKAKKDAEAKAEVERRQAEAEAARKKAEDERKAREAEEARKKAEAEAARKKAEAEAKAKAEAEAKAKAAAEAKAKAEAEAKARAEAEAQQKAIEAARQAEAKPKKGKLNREKGYPRLSYEELMALNGGHLVDSKEIEDAEIAGYIKSEQYAVDTQVTLDGGAPSTKLQTTVARMYKASPDMKAPEGMAIYDEWKVAHRRPDGTVKVPNAYQAAQGQEITITAVIDPSAMVEPEPEPEKPSAPLKGAAYGSEPKESSSSTCPMVHPISAIQKRLDKGHTVLVTQLIKGNGTYYALVEDARANGVEVLEYKFYYIDKPTPESDGYIIEGIYPTKAEKQKFFVENDGDQKNPVDVVLVEKKS
ncbi:MAG: hypothetical protein Q4E47_00630 [Candidatus Saccharibacteria bacterium]|nr:hypothetical protein [Candidatus Saccharibacteria bacterium]